MTEEVQTAETPATEAPTTETAPIQADVAPTPEQPIAATEEPSFNSTLPESFREKGYLKGIDSMEALLNKFDGAQALIGKKSVVPTAESSDEDWKAFNDELGDNLDKLNGMRVPESYEFSEVEFPEGTDMDVLNASTDKFSEIAKGAGASNKVADAIRSEWLKYEMSQTAAHQEKLDTDFTALGQETWGEGYEAKVAELSPIFQKFMPEAVRANMASVPASQLIPLMLMAEQVSNAGKPDGLPSNPAGEGQTKEDAVAKLSELRKMAQKNPAKHQAAFNDYQERTRNLRNS